MNKIHFIVVHSLITLVYGYYSKMKEYNIHFGMFLNNLIQHDLLVFKFVFPLLIVKLWRGFCSDPKWMFLLLLNISPCKLLDLLKTSQKSRKLKSRVNISIFFRMLKVELVEYSNVINVINNMK